MFSVSTWLFSGCQDPPPPIPEDKNTGIDEPPVSDNGNLPVFDKVLPVFDKKLPVRITWHKCGNDPATQAVKVDRGSWSINWKWENKSGIWCGWGTETLPTKDLSEFLNGYLVIKFTGTHQGMPPQVKFIDIEGTATELVSFDSFLHGDPATGALVKIPLKKFGMDPEFSANPKQLKTIQFEVEYNSNWGKLKISYIGFSNK